MCRCAISFCIRSVSYKLSIEGTFVLENLRLHELFFGGGAQRGVPRAITLLMMYPSRTKSGFRDELTKILDDAWEFYPDGPVGAMIGQRFEIKNDLHLVPCEGPVDSNQTLSLVSLIDEHDCRCKRNAEPRDRFQDFVLAFPHDHLKQNTK